MFFIAVIFSSSGSNLRTHIAFRHSVSFSPHYSARVPQAFFFFSFLAGVGVVKSRGQIICRMSLSWKFSDISSWLDLNYAFGGQGYDKRKVKWNVSNDIVSGKTLYQFTPISGNTNFYYVVKVVMVSACGGFSIIKFHFPPLFLSNV